jgi:2-polyprenyl-3-methyl-5-hydroxy-6-metoxy-1,4-benzoquinol methylase
MKYSIDPERNEVRALRSAASWKNMRVLEIGSGDGRLTRRLAALGANLEGIEPDAQLVQEARRSTPPRLAARIRYHTAGAERLAYPDSAFDIVIFGWSL